jgi:YYY domain-containing protein
MRYDINAISEEELQYILSISPRLAKRIISLRPFHSLEQMDQIWGMDDETRLKIKEFFYIQSDELVEEQAKEKSDNSPDEIVVEEKIEDKEILKLKQKLDRSRSSWFASLLLILIFLMGAYFRFTGINWDEGKHQHPDERYLTMVAEKIHSVGSFKEYFDTANSTLNPVGHGSYTYGMLPLFVTRYVAEWVDMTNYDSINLVGRFLSGIFDLAAIWALFLLGIRLYGRRVALVAAALSAAAVLPIQLSHFFAVDSFSTFFVVLSFYLLFLAVPIDKPNQIVTEANYIYFGLFGFLVGMAGACKVNTLPALGMIVFAGMLYLLVIFKKQKFWKSFWTIFLGLFLAGLFAFLAFRIFQPYAFNGPTISDVTINEKWLKVIKEVTNQVAGNSEWPPNHHWTSRPVQYAWVNMVLWGMGLPLGLMAWFGWGWAGYRIWKGDWRKHILPFTWVFAYFVWQNMQFWRYMRYFIPIYPFLILFAAWALVEIYQKYPLNILEWFKKKEITFSLRSNWKNGLSFLLVLLVVLGTFAYAFAFSRIYTRTHTRVEASRWIFANIPGPLNVQVDSNGDLNSYPIEVFNNRIVEKDAPLLTDFTIDSSGTTSSIKAPQIRLVGGYFHFWISSDAEGKDKITEVRSVIADDETQNTIALKISETNLSAGTNYYLQFRFRNESRISFNGISLNKNDQENPIQLELLFDNQKSGIFTGSTSFQIEQDTSINQIIIQNFQQKFIPRTARVKVSILTKDENSTPLAVSEETFDITKSGLGFDHNFDFPSISLDREKTYQLKFELLKGDVIQLLAENYTLETSWDDSLPLGVDGYNVGGIYSPFNLELYQADTSEKRDRMIEILDKSEYIIIPSNRGYDAMPRLVTRYPFTLRYYQLLFDCDCSGDEMEQWAYQLKPPFSSPLGFDLVKIFVSHPNLGSIEINDQNADESFTVYDHPKVFIFRKSDNFSIEKVREELSKVDLDNVIFQRPIDISKAPGGLKLPEDRIDAQTKEGTWSEIFNRQSLINQSSFLAIVVWYLFILMLGWITLPLTMWLFKALPDKGYSFIRMFGLLLLTWLVWLSASLKIITFSKVSILLFFILLAAINFNIFRKTKREIFDYFQSNWQHVLIVEILFLLLLFFSLYVRTANPDLWQPWYGGEKPMEFAFFNAVNIAVYFPPENPWFSDHYINYYYYGFIIAAIPTKLLGIIPSIAYNLIIPTWFAMTGIGLFGVGYNFYLGITNKNKDYSPNKSIIKNEFQAKRKFLHKINLSAYLSGLFALVIVLLIGNFFQMKLLWQYLPEVSKVTQDAGADNKFISVLSGAKNVISGDADLPGSSGRWYFAASRPILPDGPDTPIAEFPYFSFLYADLHPHLLSMPFYALGFGWCLTLLLQPIHKKRWFQQLFILIFAGLVFGFYRVTHTWDFPIFLGLGFLSIVWMFLSDHELEFEQQVKKTILYTFIFVGLSVLFYLPFTYWFKTAYNSIEIWDGARTPFKDYVIVFGLAIFTLISFFFDELKLNFRKNLRNWKSINLGQIWLPGLMILISTAGGYALWKFDYEVLAFAFPCFIVWLWIIFFKKNLSEFRRIIWVLFAIGFSLTFLVEILVLKGDVGRSNMVFRMYNLAWFILGITMSVAIVHLRNRLKSWPIFVEYGWLIIFVLLLLLGTLYPITATKMKMIDRWPNVENPPNTLDGSLFMLGNPTSHGVYTPAIYRENEIDLDLRLDYEGIKFLQDNVVGSSVIVEGHTSEYRWGGRYSIYTGLPSVIGWSWHTRQHNSLLDRAVVDKRIEDVNNFYNTINIDEVNGFIERYRVQYIIISGLERALYSPEGLEKFENMVDSGQLSILFGRFSNETALILGTN